MLVLKKLVLRDFMSFKDVTIDFSAPGLYLIQGYNSKNYGSNGAGKTAILSGITWTLFNKTQLGLQGKDVVRWGQDSCVGMLTLEDGDKVYQIVRSPETLEFFIDGIQQEGHKRDLQETINTTLRIDYQKFVTFSIFTKQWSKFVTEVGDAERKRLFKNILSLHKLDEAADKAKRIYNSLSIEATKAQQAVDSLREQLDKATVELTKYRELLRTEEQARQMAIQEIERKKDAMRPAPVDHSAEIDSINKTLATYGSENLAEKLQQAHVQFSNAQAAMLAAEQDVEKYDEKIRVFSTTVGGDCPTCGQPVPMKYKAMFRRQLEALRKDAFDIYQERRTVCDALHSEICSIEDKVNEINKLNNRLREIDLLMWQYNASLEKYEEFCKSADVTIKQLHSSANTYKTIIQAKEDEIERLRESLTKQEARFKAVTDEMDIFNYLIWLYSRHGVVTVIIEKCFSRLKFLANKFLTKLSSEGFRLDISPKKALKSGEVRDEVDIFILDGTKKIPYAALSAGQQQRVNLALLLALYFWGRELGGNNFSLLLLDEICDLSLDEKGQEDVLSVLQSLKPQIAQILLITHKNVLTSQYDTLITVHRNEQGISYLA